MVLKRVINWMTSWGGALGDSKGQQIGLPTEPIFSPLETVTAEKALQLSSVYSCVELLANTMSTLPIFVYRRLPNGGRQADRDNRLFILLHDKPNDWMTPAEFVSVMTINRLLKGNAFALIERDNAGTPIAVIPLAAEQMEVATTAGGEVFLYYQGGDVFAYAPENIIHWKGLGNGYIGLSKIEFMRASSNEAINAQHNATMLFGKGSKPSGILQTDQKLNEDQLTAVLERFGGMARGGNGLFLVDRGFKYSQMSLSPADAQLLESRRFAVEEICRWFGVPPVLVGASGATTWGSGIAEIVSGFHKFTLNPLCVQFQQALARRLIPLEDRSRFFIEMKLDMLLKSSAQERADFYSKMTQNGLMTRNEVRGLENLPPYEAGDSLTVQSNLVPVEKLGETAAFGSSPADGSPVRQ